MSRHLSASSMPRVFILRIPKKFINVPNTGSAVLCRNFIMPLPLWVCILSFIRSYRGLFKVSVILLIDDLPPQQVLRNEHWEQSLELLRYSFLYCPSEL